jgi:uncharacterized protein (TIRG00374 family)
MTSLLRRWQIWLGGGISLLLIYLLLHGLDWQQMTAAFYRVDPWLVALAVLVTTLSYLLRAVRWGVILAPIKRITFVRLVEATMIGYLANNILPARLGEVARAYLLGRKERVSPAGVLATLVVERLADIIVVLLMLVLTIWTIKLPVESPLLNERLAAAGWFTLVLFLLALVILFLLQRHGEGFGQFLLKRLTPWSSAWASRIERLATAFTQGLRFPPGRGSWLLLVVSSLAIWMLATWPIDLVFRSFGIVLPMSASLLVMLLLVLAVMVPASPGNIGTFHAACVYGLAAFGIPRAEALSVAIVMHGVSLLPVLLLGFFGLWRQQLSFADLGSAAMKGE